MNTLPTRPSYIHSADDWSQLRAHFMSSMLMDIHLHKLGQNIGLSWPLRGQDETPSKYMDYTFEELPMAPGLEGQPQRLNLLMEILKETASFDQPFQNMVETVVPPSRKKETTLQLLKRHEIPPGFPVKFTGLSAATKDLCKAEGCVTISDSIQFLQNLAQNILVNGEIKGFLNALTNGDARALAAFLPLRTGEKGIHFAEAIGIIVRSLPKSQFYELANYHLTRSDKPLPPELERIEVWLCGQIEHLFPWFHEEKSMLASQCEAGDSIERFLMPLNNPECEAIAKALVLRLFPGRIAETKPRSLFHRMTSLWRGSKT